VARRIDHLQNAEQAARYLNESLAKRRVLEASFKKRLREKLEIEATIDAIQKEAEELGGQIEIAAQIVADANAAPTDADPPKG